MACEGCERRRQAMKQMMASARDHAARLAGLRKGNAKQPAELQAVEANSPDAPPEGSEQAGTKGAEHKQRGVEGAKATRADTGRLSVPRVRKAGGGKAGARGSRGRE